MSPAAKMCAHVGAQRVVDHDVPALDVHAGCRSADEIGVAGPADGEEDRVDINGLGRVARLVGDTHARSEWPERLDVGAGDDVDATVPVRMLERCRDVLVGAWHDPGGVFQQRDVAAEIGQDRSELAAGVGGPDDADTLRERLEVAHVFEREAQFGTGDRQTGGPPTDGDDHPVGTPGATIRRADGVGVEELDIARLLDHGDARIPDAIGDPSAIVGVVGHPLGVGQCGRHVHLGPWSAQTERLPRAPVADQSRGPGQRANGRRPAVEGRATDATPLDERDFGSEADGVECGGDAGGSAPDHQHAHVAHSFTPAPTRGHSVSAHHV